MDQMLLDMGLAINDSSAYKTMKREAIWIDVYKRQGKGTAVYDDHFFHLCPSFHSDPAGQ